ncbi:MAG: hypothetical protein LBT66_02155 [Methanobrevibacter sp.]|jgi:hypothetical protein|nr:hypothetical protein [Candidatus Methanovirga meridionalis]
MGIKLTIKGKSEEIKFDKDNIVSAKFISDTPDDSNARASELSAILEIKGKIITPVDGETADDTLKLATWSLVPSESSDAYRDVTLEVISGSIMVRKANYPNAFVVDYREDYTSVDGVGTFTVLIKQKKEKIENVKIEGGYKAEE